MQHNRRQILRNLAASAALAGISSPALGRSLGDIADLNLVAAGDFGAEKLSWGYAGQLSLVPEQRAICRSTSAVVEAVKWARDRGQGFALRSGGHGFTGHSQHSKLVIDTRGMTGVDVDPASRIVTAEAGCVLGLIYKALAPHGLTLNGGTHGNVGLAGFTLGGGFGYLCRSHGLLIDQLIEVEMVTADGVAVTASRDANPDLFWGLRGGGGGQFGVATRFRFRAGRSRPLHRFSVVERVEAARAVEVLYLWGRWMQSASLNTCAHMAIQRDSDTNILFIFKGLADGDAAFVRDQLAKVLRRQTPVSAHHLTPGMTADHLLATAPFTTKPIVNLYSQSTLLRGPLSAPVAQDVVQVVLRHPTRALALNFEAWGGNMARIAPEATAFVHRRALGVVHAQANGDTIEANQIIPAMADLRRALAPDATGGVYVNYPETAASLPNWADAYWGTNLPRLKALKHAWDPEDIFTHAQSLAKA